MFELIKKRIINNENNSIKNIKQMLQGAKSFENSYNNLQIKYKDATKDARYIGQITLTDKQQQKTLTEQKQIIIKKYAIQQSKLTNKYLKRLQAIEESPESAKQIEISILWKKSATWGMNPSAELTSNKYYKGTTIGGCGYDKGSTATAQVLNQDKSIIKLLCVQFERYLRTHKEEQKKITTINGEAFGVGYGCSAWEVPSFDGGVGITCHKNILNKLNYKTVADHETKTSNYLLFEKVSKKASC